MATPLVKKLFTVDDYHKMGDAGILGEDDRVELIEGEIVQISPIGSRHAGSVNRVAHLLMKALGNRAVVSIQNPVELDEHNEFQPDIAVLKPREDYYTSHIPGPKDVLFLIEVADSSEDRDLNHKVPLYARRGIEESWVVLVERNEIVVGRAPSAEGYKDVTRLSAGATLSPLAFSDLKFPFESILPPVR
jgi:Uma2 family endonuclease